MERKIRIVMGKPGLDGHDRGIKVLASSYRDAGMEVIYLGLRQSLNNAYNTIFKNVLSLMKEKGLNDVLLVGGGIIPKKDIARLEKDGVGKLFGPGTPVQDTVDFITDWVNTNRR